MLGRCHYHWKHEPCWYGVRAGGNGHWHGDRSQTTLWEISGRKQDATKQTTLWPIAGRGQHAETAHGTQKPVECMPYLLHHRRLDLDRRHPAHDALVTGRDVFLQHPLRHVIVVQPPPPTAMGRRQRPAVHAEDQSLQQRRRLGPVLV